jgi:hypothetical protein
VPESAWRHPIAYVLNRMVRFAANLLSKPVASYTLSIPNDLAQLVRIIRKGDVLLVEGNERISEVIKFLTQSSWSHSALYVGDEAVRRDPSLRGKFGDDADHLVVEALVKDGVVLTPLASYREFNIRLCRPWGLTPADQQEVVNYALENVGKQYDLRNLFDLARYFLPVSIVPARLRRQALEFGSTNPTRLICSSLIAECFARVRFPIVPRFEPLPPEFTPPRPRRALGLVWRRGAEKAPRDAMRRVASTLITPRDFDLSPYFAIVKFNVIEGSRFDYHKLLWIEEPAAGADSEPREKSA